MMPRGLGGKGYPAHGWNSSRGRMLAGGGCVAEVRDGGVRVRK
jgi:hypothetical protein